MDIFCEDCPKPRKIGKNPGKRQSSQKKWPFFVRGWQRPLSCVQKCHKPDTAHAVFGQFVQYLDELCHKTTIFGNSSHDRTTEPAPNSQAHIASDREGDCSLKELSFCITREICAKHTEICANKYCRHLCNFAKNI